MNDLHTTVLNKLAGSSRDKPVDHAILQQHTADVCKDIDALDDMLDKLLQQRIVNMVNGRNRHGKYRHYWLTGAVNPSQSFNLADRPQQPQPEKVKPKTSIPPNKEITMQSKPGSLRDELFKLIVAQPGIGRDELFSSAKKNISGFTEIRLKQTLGNLMTVKQIMAEGKKGAKNYYPAKVTTGKTANPTKPVAKSGAKPAEKVRKAVPAVKPPPAAHEAMPINGKGKHYRLGFGVHVDGSVLIHKDGKSIELTALEFTTLSFIAQSQGASA